MSWPAIIDGAYQREPDPRLSRSTPAPADAVTTHPDGLGLPTPAYAWRMLDVAELQPGDSTPWWRVEQVTQGADAVRLAVSYAMRAGVDRRAFDINHGVQLPVALRTVAERWAV